MHASTLTAARPRPLRPFNVSRWFAIVGFVSITFVSTVCALLASYFLSERMLRQEGLLTMEFVQSLVLTEDSLRAYFNGTRPKNSPELRQALQHIAALPDTLRANLYDRHRTVIWSTEKNLVGRTFGANSELDAALSGELVIHPDFDGPSKEEHEKLTSDRWYFVEVYAPVRDGEGGPVIGVVELYKSPKALNEALVTVRMYTVAGAALAGLFLYVALFGLSRRADAVIAEQQRRLLESEVLATVGELGSAVAHGIRNPLASIRSSAELALDSPPDIAREAARDIINDADRLEAWVRSLLSYARPVVALPEAVVLPALVEAAIQHFEKEMDRRGIRRSAHVPDTLPAVKGDRLLLGQVLNSLLANAIEAMEHSGRLEVACRALTDAGQVELTIRDSGPGMTPEQLQHVFTPFYTTKPAGLGIGLALARRIVERFGGRIAIESAPGAGTAVRLTMPAA